MNKPAKQFTEAQRQETKEWLRNPDRLAKEAKEEATQIAVRRRRIKTRRQQLQREAKAGRCTDARKGEIEQELSDLKGLEEQLCGRREPKHPSSRPSAEELGFDPKTLSADEILEVATIQRGLRAGKAHHIFAKLAEMNGDDWGEEARQEAKHNPKIERTRKRIGFGDIKGISEGKLAAIDHVIAGNYFKSRRLTKPLRELSADKASPELRKLGVAISPQAFERALRRLALVD